MGHDCVVSGHPKSIGIPWVYRLSTGPPGLGRNISGDCLRTLDGVLKLILDLINTPTRWMSICVHKGEPGVTGGGGLLNQGNGRSRDRANKSAKDQFVLLNLREKLWIWRILIGEASCGRWTRVRSIDKFMEVIADEDSFNLNFPGEVVC